MKTFDVADAFPTPPIHSPMASIDARGCIAKCRLPGTRPGINRAPSIIAGHGQVPIHQEQRMSTIKPMKPLAIALGTLLVSMALGQPAFAQDSAMPSSSMQKQSMMHDNMAAMWNTADTDHDGYISKAEYDAFATKQFTKMDSNGDGKLSKDEMLAGETMMHPKMSHSEMTKMWRAMDTDSKSSISQHQYMAHADKMFAKWDTNGDGKLSKDEMKAGMKAMKH